MNLGQILYEESYKKGYEEGYKEGYKEGLETARINKIFKSTISIMEEFHMDFKRALIVLKITNPKEQDFYLKKYEDLKNSH